MNNIEIIFFIIYVIIGILHGIADWIFTSQFSPKINVKKRIVGAINTGILWPLYWIKYILE
ncbi:MAG TPA: hypothetical protein PLC59_00475 [Bacteroidales bacterium]|jgi:hypothetical protein|nr:hypothetical protein [Bacteroidales bacterium]HQI44539.1 hypothetical protein [Bacteroidales bacterium]